jgi:putative pyruvate formate lyase activating enzyme
MAQYYPSHHAGRYPTLSRGITEPEYSEVVSLVEKLGMENGWIQEMSASDNYQPDFERDSHPFNQV